MAGNRIKGITIEIGGDTTKLTDSLKGIDKSLKNTQSQLKDVDKLLKLDPKNTDLLKQKQELLAKQVKTTKERLEELKKAQAQMDANGVDKNSEQYKALQREIEATEQDLKKAQDAAKDFGSVLSQQLKSAGQDMKKFSEDTRAMSTAAAGLAAGMVGMAVNAGKTADDLLTLSRNTGFSVEELQKMQYASDLVDVSMDQMTGSVQKLTKQMASGSDAFDKLGVSITDENGNMRDATEVWYDSLLALSQIENGTERDQIAMELFGKSAMDLSGIVDDGGEALKNFGQEAEDMGLILDEEGVQNAAKFNDELDKLKNQAGQAFLEAGAALAESLLPMLGQLAETISSVIIWFSDLDGGTQTLILTILGLVAAISPIAGIISGICTIGGVLAGITAPMAGVFLAIAGAVAAVVAIGVVLYQNWDTIKQKGAELMQAVSTTWNNIKTTIGNAVSGAWSTVSSTFENIRSAISSKIDSAKETVRNAINAIKGFFNFSWSLPHIALPHFSISGKFSLNPPSIPHISVDWYAKAMENGMILNSPTIFGMQNGRLLGAGEAGPEVVVGASSLYDMINSAVGKRTITAPVNVSVTVNGSVDDSDRFARQLGDRLATLITRSGEVYR